LSTGPAPAPLISSLNSDFGNQTQKIADTLNRIHDGRIQVHAFGSMAELADVLQGIMADCQPYAHAL